MKIVILAGGSGTRLFPLSRGDYPKQFLKINGRTSFLQQTAQRFLGVVKPKDIVVVTNQKYFYHVQSQMAEIGLQDSHVICEPEGRNTAPAIAMATVYCQEKMGAHENECIFVSPSDHIIQPAERFAEVVKRVRKTCETTGAIVTIGIKPTSPETGYGYIYSGEKKSEYGHEVLAFKEKPTLEVAQKYISSGKYYWNAGMFAFTTATMFFELQKNAVEIYDLASRGYRKLMQNFADMPNISIDYAVAEKAANMQVYLMQDIYWNDVGSFDAIAETIQKRDGNRIIGDWIGTESEDNLIIGNHRLICTVGVSNLIIADTPDVLMICERGHSQQVKKIVNKLKDQERAVLQKNITTYCPWGSYTILSADDGYKVEKLIINPGSKLDKQLHYHRSVHWTVLQGKGRLTVNDKTTMFRENESTYIPIAAQHCLENPGRIPLIVIEVQNGKYLGEDDVVYL